MEQQSLMDKIKSWKRWLLSFAASIPIFIYLYGADTGLPMSIGLSVVGMLLGVIGLAAGDSMKLFGVAASLIAAITKKPAPKDLPEPPSVPEDVK